MGMKRIGRKFNNEFKSETIKLIQTSGRTVGFESPRHCRRHVQNRHQARAAVCHMPDLGTAPERHK